MRVIAFPWAGTPYNELFYTALERTGIEVVEGVYSGRWISANVRRGDVVHFHWPSFHYFYPGSTRQSFRRLLKYASFMAWMRMRGARIAWTAHNLYPHEGGKSLAVHRWGRRVVTRLSSYVCVHGESSRRLVRSEFGVPERKLVGIHHGHFIGYYPDVVTAAQARQTLGLREDERVFLFLGICKPYKGLEELLGAFRRRPGRSRLIIAGAFQTEQYQRAIEQLVAVDDRVSVIPGRVPNDQVQVYLKAADFVVLPYRGILTSGAAMLALSFGRPVVAPALGEVQALVTPEVGVLYAADDPVGLENALSQADGSSFDPQLVQARARSFDWDSSAAAFAEALRRP